MPSLKKIEKTQQLAKLLTDKKNFVVVKFGSTSHKRMEVLRKILKSKMAKLLVIKNTLFEKTLENLINLNQSLKSVKEKFIPLKQNSAVLTFDGDWIEGLSAFYQFAKEEKTLSFKFGFLDNLAYDQASLVWLATLPSKQELLGKIIGSLKSSSARLVYAIKFSQIKLAYVISQIGKKKGGEENG